MKRCCIRIAGALRGSARSSAPYAYLPDPVGAMGLLRFLTGKNIPEGLQDSQL